MEIFYEESMPTELTDHDYSIYYIPEHFSDFDRLNYIIKKGKPFQQQALLNNITQYISKISLFLSLINFIIENIEIWDQQTQLLFPESLYKAIQSMFTLLQIKNPLLNTITNTIIKHMLNAIAMFDEIVSDEYVKYFEMIVESIRREIKNKKIEIELNKELFEFVVSLGKFGQSVRNKKLCLLFCSRLSLINKSDLLFNRFILLSEETETETKCQIALELKYFLEIYYNDKTTNNYNKGFKGFFNVIIEYIKNNNEQIIQTETICSVIYNLEIIWKYKLLVNILHEQLHIIFNELEYDKTLLCNIIKLYINKAIFIKNKYPTIFEKVIINLNEIIESFLKFCDYTPDNSITTKNENNDYEIKCVTTLLDCYENLYYLLSDCVTHDNEELFTKIFYLIINEDLLCNKSNIDYKQSFYTLLHKIIPYLPKNYYKNFISMHLKEEKNKFIIFSSENFPFFINNSDISQVFHTLLSSPRKYQTLFPFLISMITSLIGKDNIPISKHNILCLIIKDIIKEVFNNSLLFQRKEELYTKLFEYVKKIFDQNNGYLIKASYIKLFAHLIKYSTKREEYLKYVRSNYYDNPSFYTRRLYKPFIEELFEIISMKFALDNSIFHDYITSFHDNSSCLSCSYIILFQKLYPIVYYYDKSNQIINQLKAILLEKHNDIELNTTITNVINCCNNISASQIEESKEKEIKKVKHEQNIFLKETSCTTNCNCEPRVDKQRKTSQIVYHKNKHSAIQEFNIHNKKSRPLSKQVIRVKNVFPKVNSLSHSTNSCQNKDQKKLSFINHSKQSNKQFKKTDSGNITFQKSHISTMKSSYLFYPSKAQSIDNITFSNLYSTKTHNYNNQLFCSNNKKKINISNINSDKKIFSPLTHIEQPPINFKRRSSKQLNLRKTFKLASYRGDEHSNNLILGSKYISPKATHLKMSTSKIISYSSKVVNHDISSFLIKNNS